MGALGVSARARTRPGAAAIIDLESGRETSYAELDDRAARLAGALAERGVAAGDRVAVTSLGRAEVFETQLACARLGAAMVPINWRLSAAEIEGVLEAARPKAAILDPDVDRAVPGGAPRPPVPGLVVGESYERALEGAIALPARRPAAGEVAQILYTSGTTGRPKGALLPWRQIAFNAAATAALCRLGEATSCLALLPTFHTGGLNCLATPVLAAGGTVWLMRRFDAGRAASLLASGRIDATVAVPAMYRALLDAGLDELPPRLRELLCGGAPLPGDLAAAFAARGRPLRQGFGMTEVGPNCFTGSSHGDVGSPTPGTEARIVDERGAPLPEGEVGELELSGPHVCLGYFENPEATAAAIGPEGWFRTGDLARSDAGRFTVCGRKKEMFISGGENVYPAEVEAALSLHPEVAGAAVVGVPDCRWGEVGAAVVVWRRPGSGDADSLADFARARLAGYKVPRHWLSLAELPATASGKVSKAAVRDLFLSAPDRFCKATRRTRP